MTLSKLSIGLATAFVLSLTAASSNGQAQAPAGGTLASPPVVDAGVAPLIDQDEHAKTDIFVPPTNPTKAIIGVEKADLLKKDPNDPNMKPDERAKIIEEVAQTLNDEKQNIGVVLDGSGSMGQILEKNKSKMFFLKKLMKEFVRAQWKLDNKIGVKVYGSRAKNDCTDIYNPIPFTNQSVLKLENKLESMEPVGMTPLYKSIDESIQDISKFPEPRKILIVTDGEDTCGGDPCKTAEKMKKDNLKIQFFVIALGFSGSPDTLQKLKCLGGDVTSADSESSFSDAMGQASSKMRGGQNLKVISPNPNVPVYLYRIEGKDRKLERVFYASSDQRVPPGNYEAVVGLTPLYKFPSFVIKPGQRTTLKVEGEGEVLVNYFGKHLNVQLLNKDNKVVYRFKSDTPTNVATGKYKLRIFKNPFYEQLVAEFFVYPNGKPKFDVTGVGLLRVDSPKLEGLYVYNSQNQLIDKTLTGSTIVIKSGVYGIHVRENCTYDQVVLRDDKQVLVLQCP